MLRRVLSRGRIENHMLKQSHVEPSSKFAGNFPAASNIRESQPAHQRKARLVAEGLICGKHMPVRIQDAIVWRSE